MNPVNKGHIKISRKYFQNFLWNEKREFSRAEAWLDLIQSARYSNEPSKELINGRMVICKRGQIVASVRFLKERWNWKSTSTVDRFLKLLKDEQMIGTDMEQGINVISICNYEVYNKENNIDGTAIRTVIEHQRNGDKTETEHARIEDKTVNSVNTEVTTEVSAHTPAPEYLKIGNLENLPLELRNDFIEICKFIFTSDVLKVVPQPLSAGEYQKLRDQYNAIQIKQILEEMANKPKNIKNVQTIYLTALTWLRKSHGTTLQQECEDDFKKLYREFIVRISNGEITKPQISADDNRYLRTIIDHLLENNAVSFKEWEEAGKPTDKKFQNKDGALKVWEYILTNWSKLDAFEQKRSKLSEISTDLQKIIITMKNKKTNEQNNPTGNSAAVNNGKSNERKNFAEQA